MFLCFEGACRRSSTAEINSVPDQDTGFIAWHRNTLKLRPLMRLWISHRYSASCDSFMEEMALPATGRGYHASIKGHDWGLNRPILMHPKLGHRFLVKVIPVQEQEESRQRKDSSIRKIIIERKQRPRGRRVACHT